MIDHRADSALGERASFPRIRENKKKKKKKKKKNYVNRRGSSSLLSARYKQVMEL